MSYWFAWVAPACGKRTTLSGIHPQTEAVEINVSPGARSPWLRRGSSAAAGSSTLPGGVEASEQPSRTRPTHLVFLARREKETRDSMCWGPLKKEKLPFECFNQHGGNSTKGNRCPFGGPILFEKLPLVLFLPTYCLVASTDCKWEQKSLHKRNVAQALLKPELQRRTSRQERCSSLAEAKQDGCFSF